MRKSGDLLKCVLTAFCTEEELVDSGVAEEYRQFLRRFREEYVYELLRDGRREVRDCRPKFPLHSALRPSCQ